MTETISAIELAWTGVTATGWALASLRGHRLYARIRRLRRAGQNGPAQLVFLMRARSQAFQAVTFEGFVGVGLLALTLPPNPAAVESGTTWLTTAVLLGCTALLVVQGLVQDHDLRRLEAYQDVQGYQVRGC